MWRSGFNNLNIATRIASNTFFYWTVIIESLIVIGAPKVWAATLLQDRFDKISNTGLGSTSVHTIGFTYTDMSVPVGSVKFEFCSNDPIPESACVAPTGFDLSSASIINQSGETGFAIDAGSTQNMLILTRPAFLPTSGVSTYEIGSVVNPTVDGTYYIRLLTYTSVDGTGLPIQYGGIAISNNTPLVLSTEVPPYLYFCTGLEIVSYDCSSASGFFVDLGELSKTQAKTSSSQMVTATNAASGFSISVAGTTFTSGNNIVDAIINPTTSIPGSNQFGINLRDNSNPDVGADPVGPGLSTPKPDYNILNKFKFVAGDSIVSSPTPQDYRKFTVSYLINTSNALPPGYYATTLTYICLANF